MLALRSKVRRLTNLAEVNGFFQDIKILRQVFQEGLKAGGPESEISDLLKNFKPEKIGL